MVDKRVQTQYLGCNKYARIHSTAKREYDAYSFLIDISSNTLILGTQNSDSSLYYVNGRTNTAIPSVYKIGGAGKYKFYFKNNADLSTDIFIEKENAGPFVVTKINFAIIGNISTLTNMNELDISSLTEVVIK